MAASIASVLVGSTEAFVDPQQAVGEKDQFASCKPFRAVGAFMQGTYLDLACDAPSCRIYVFGLQIVDVGRSEDGGGILGLAGGRKVM